MKYCSRRVGPINSAKPRRTAIRAGHFRLFRRVERPFSWAWEQLERGGTTPEEGLGAGVGGWRPGLPAVTTRGLSEPAL